MARIPQYNRSIAPQDTPYAYQNANVNADMFGANVYKAQSGIADAGSNLGDGLLDLKAQYDRTKVLENTNLISKWANENLYDKDNGYFYKFGKEAMGKSPEILESYDKYTDELVAKSGLPFGYQEKLKRVIEEKRLGYEREIEAHDKKQTDAWQDSVFADSINNIQSDLNKNRNNPDAMEVQLRNFDVVFDNYAAIKGWDKDPETYAIKKKAGLAAIKASTLDAYLAEGSLKAREFFEKNEDFFTPEQRNQYAAKIHNEEVNYTARETAKNLIGLDTEQAYTYINNIANIDERNATEREYSRLLSQQNAIQTEKNNQFMGEISNRLADALANGSDAIDLKREIMMSDLPFEVKQKQIAYINDCVELGQEISLWNNIEYLENLKNEDFEMFQKTDLSKFNLTKSEYEKYRTLQKKVVEYSTEDELRDMVKKFDTFFLPGKNSLDSGVYKDELVGMLARIEKMQGEAFDIKKIDEGSLKALIQGFHYKDETMSNKNIDETKELYMRAKAVADIQDRVAKSYVRFKNVNKREPEPQEMYNMVLRAYNDAGREHKAKLQSAMDNKMNLIKEIKDTPVTKTGYTKVLTHFENKTIPDMEKKLGFKINITSTYRSTGKYGHEKGMKADIFPANPTKENILRTASELIQRPDVEIIFTSHPDVLRIYGTNSKVKSAVNYDNSQEAKKAGINHVNHFDITLSSKYGGTEQPLKYAEISAAKPPVLQNKR